MPKKKTLILLSILLPLLLIVFVAYKLRTPGYLIYTDVTESTGLSKIYEKYLYTYSDTVGEALPEKARIPIVMVIMAVIKAFSLDTELYNKIKILLLLFTAGVAFYTTSILFLKKVLNLEKVPAKYHVYVTFGTLFYLTNFWMTNRIMHFHLFFASVTIPLFFYILYDYFFSEKAKYHLLVLLAVISAVFTATPHIILFEALIFFAIILAYLITSKSHIHKKLIRISGLGIFVILFTALNMYWLLPAIKSNSVPDAVPSEDIVEFLGKNSTLLNEIKLTGYLFSPDTGYIPKSVEVISLLPLALLLVVLWALRKNKISLILTITFGIALFLSSITPLSERFYYYLMFHSPIKSMGWIFRETDKFGVFLAYIYSLAIVFFLETYQHNKKRFAIAIGLVVLTLAPHLYFLNKTLDLYYKPQDIPVDFNNVNRMLTRDINEFNVLWYPGVPHPTWATTEEVQYTFSNLISAKPTITTRSDMIHYVEYIMDTNNLDQINLGKALDIVGVKYLILRNDHNDTSLMQKLQKEIDDQNSLVKIYTSGSLELYENKEFSGIAKLYTNRLVTNIGLEVLKILDELDISTSNTMLDFTDNPAEGNLEGLNTQYFIVEGNSLEYKVNQFKQSFIFPADYVSKVENGFKDAWRKASLKDLKHAESKLFLESKGIYNSQLDYDKLVVNAYDAYEFKDGVIKNDISNTVPLAFNQQPNVKLTNNTLEYTPNDADYLYEWNTIRSDIFSVKNVTALHIKAVDTTESDLQLHLKLRVFDKENTLVKSYLIRPNNQRLIDQIIKLDTQSETAEFSIWTKSIPTKHIAFRLNLLAVTNVSDQVQPLTMELETKNESCHTNCVVLARAYKGTEGGELNIEINGNKFAIDTRGNQDMYLWQYAGRLTKINDSPVKIKLINNIGFSSVNALAILNESDYNSINTSLEKPNSQINLGVVKKDSNIMPIAKVDPTKYIVTLPKGVSGILGFSKPYNQNWTYSNGTGTTKSTVTNGFVNGWDLPRFTTDTPAEISFLPQFYFSIGALISSITALFCIGYFFIWFKKQ